MNNLLREIESEEVAVYRDRKYSVAVLAECREIHRSLVENGKLEGCFAADKWMGYSGVKKCGIDFSLELELYKTHIGSEFGITAPAMKNMLRCYAICCSGAQYKLCLLILFDQAFMSFVSFAVINSDQ